MFQTLLRHVCYLVRVATRCDDQRQEPWLMLRQGEIIAGVAPACTCLRHTQVSAQNRSTISLSNMISPGPFCNIVTVHCRHGLAFELGLHHHHLHPWTQADCYQRAACISVSLYLVAMAELRSAAWTGAATALRCCVASAAVASAGQHAQLPVLSAAAHPQHCCCFALGRRLHACI